MFARPVRLGGQEEFVMVSPQSSVGTVGSDVARTDRGFVTDVATSPTTYSSNLTYLGHHHYFWGPVIAGTLVVFSVFMLSMSLMFGCHVGTYNPSGALSFGAGAAWWIVITSCIAYFFGGMMAGAFHGNNSADYDDGALRGLAVWGLSVPLFMVIFAVISGGAGLAYGYATNTIEQATNATGAAHVYHGNLFVNYGGAWTVFASLICGLFFSWVAGMFGRGGNRVNVTRTSDVR